MADPLTLGIATAAAATAGSSALSAAQQSSAGRIRQQEAETAAQQEELSATQREADRKGRLAEALASQNAAAAAGGVASFEGSPLSILQQDVAREERATGRDVMQTRLAAGTQRARGRVARSLGRGQAGLSLLRGVAESANIAASNLPRAS